MSQFYENTIYTLRSSVGLANLDPPVVSLYRDNGKLGQDDGLSDGSGYLLGALNTQTNMTIVVPNSNKSLEPGTSGQPESASALVGSLEPHPLGMCPGKS